MDLKTFQQNVRNLKSSEPDELDFLRDFYNMFYNKNFGSVSRADIDTFLFTVYYQLQKKLESTSVDDYSLSHELGITETKVRNLKVRMELKYPSKEKSWKREFISLIQKAKYDKEDCHVKVMIPDVNVLNEVKHYIEQLGLFDDVTLNHKLLNLPIYCFIDVVFALTESDGDIPLPDDVKEIIQTINNEKKQNTAIKKLQENVTFSNLKAALPFIAKKTVGFLVPFLGDVITKVASQYIKAHMA